MLQFDQDSSTVRRMPSGASALPGEGERVLDELAREIEETQRQQTETLSNIVERLRTIDVVRRGEAAPRRQYMTLGEGAGDEPWDEQSAEDLMRSYESDVAETAAWARQGLSKAQQEWIGGRFNDVAERIAQAVSDLKPGHTVSLLEERLDGVQKLISTALDDVVRRADLEGMRVIEQHVNDLTDKLEELERHVSRIDGIESDVRSVMEQVSDERIAKLLDYDSRFVADIEAVAKRAAEEVHARFAIGGSDEAAETRRHDELRSLIEASIHDRREAEVQAVSLVAGLSGRVNAQADRYDELKGLLETAIQEQRQNEQTALGMLDTLQQALVTVLDRMDALEQQQLKAIAAPAPASPEPVLGPALETYTFIEEEADALSYDVAASPQDAPYQFRDTRFETFNAKAEAETPPPMPDADAPTSEAAPESAVARMRADFIADARRAKLKATANRAEAMTAPDVAAKPDAIAQVRSALTQPARPAGQSGQPTRLFGMSTKLLAGVLALIIAINGGLLLLNRKSARPAAPAIHPSETHGANDVPMLPAPGGESGEANTPADKAPGPRTELDGMVPEHTLPALNDDVLNPPDVETLGSELPSEAPRGTTVAKSPVSAPTEAVASIYEQQVLASLSGQLGMIAAGKSASALLPEEGGRFAAAYTKTDELPQASSEGASLELPPATVGPLSLRMAAANGDASAQFEVAARLAEGNGTDQNYAQAMQWYQRSAAKGFAQSQYRLGTFYERGLGVKKDAERAKTWYLRAAESGNVKAMHNVAVLSTSGEHGEPDFKLAAPWFEKAAEFGLADSQYNLGVVLENGLAGKTDRVAAYKWYALAAKTGDKDATDRRDALKSALSADDLKAAQDMVSGFSARRASPLANDARAAGEDWKKRANAASDDL